MEDKLSAGLPDFELFHANFDSNSPRRVLFVDNIDSRVPRHISRMDDFFSVSDIRVVKCERSVLEDEVDSLTTEKAFRRRSYPTWMLAVQLKQKTSFKSQPLSVSFSFHLILEYL